MSKNLDANAQSGGRVRRNWANMNKGAGTALIGTSPPIVINGSNQVALQLATSGGLTVSGATLALLLQANSGLVLGTTGLAIGAVTTKGDILAYGTFPTRLAVGTNSQFLIADSTQALGVKWGSSISNLTITTTLNTPLTAKSIPFVGTAGLLTEDNSNLAWDSTNRRLGVGTNAPGTTLDVVATSATMRFTSYGGGGTGQFRRALGTVAAPTALTPGASMGTFSFQGYDGAAFRSAGSFGFSALAIANPIVVCGMFFNTVDTLGNFGTRISSDATGAVHFNYNAAQSPTFGAPRDPAAQTLVLHNSDAQTGNAINLVQSDNDGGLPLMQIDANGTFRTASSGVATLVAGTVTVATVIVTASSIIMLTPQNSGANIGSVGVSARTAGTSFTITSSNPLDDRVIGFVIFEPPA